MEVVEGPASGGGDGGARKGGLGFATTALFLITQMAGAGFLSLPKAVANAGVCVCVCVCMCVCVCVCRYESLILCYLH